MKILTFEKDVEIGEWTCKKKLNRNTNTTKICSLSSKFTMETREQHDLMSFFVLQHFSSIFVAICLHYFDTRVSNFF